MSTNRQYELVYILPPETPEQDAAAVHDQVAAIVGRFSGAVERTEPWGRRKLAYEIGPHKEGLYVLEVLNGPGEMIKELDRRLKVTDLVVRHLVVRVDEELSVAERRRTKRKAAMARRRVARGLPPEPAPGEGRRGGESGEDANGETGHQVEG